jgi:hypothetical protein
MQFGAAELGYRHQSSTRSISGPGLRSPLRYLENRGCPAWHGVGSLALVPSVYIVAACREMFDHPVVTAAWYSAAQRCRRFSSGKAACRVEITPVTTAGRGARR